MRTIPDRAVFTIARLDGLWVVEHDGLRFGHSPDKEVAMAAANKQVRQLQDAGRACQVREGVRLEPATAVTLVAVGPVVDPVGA